MAQILETAAAQSPQLPDPDRHQGRPHPRERARATWCWSSGCAAARAQGGNAGTRAALIGGADFTSNVGVSHVLGYPPKGTHAHSMVQIFMTLGHGRAGGLPGLRRDVPRRLPACWWTRSTPWRAACPMPSASSRSCAARATSRSGVRLDSGDLAYLSIQVGARCSTRPASPTRQSCCPTTWTSWSSGRSSPRSAKRRRATASTPTR